MRTKHLKYIFGLLILADIGYTFLQCYYMMNTDGDMAGIIMPSESYRKVLQDPLGLHVLFKNEVYAAPNRFFPHFFMSTYFKSAPFFFQHFVNPIQSVFLSMAVARTFFHVVILLLVAAFITGGMKVFNEKFIAAALVITPFFQISGYERFMGITDASITYSFFYAGTVLFVLLYLFLFYRSCFWQQHIRFNSVTHIFLILLAFVIAFGGSLCAPIVLIVCSGVLLFLFSKEFNNQRELDFVQRVSMSLAAIPPALLFHFSFMIALAFYSFYIGRNNEENLWTELPLLDRYLRLPKGFLVIVLKNKGMPVLMAATLLNVILIRQFKEAKAQRIFVLVKYLILFSAVYLLLLPLGGYRSYRPNIIRYDTFMPITLCLIFTYGITALYLVKHYREIRRVGFILYLVAIMFWFTKADTMNRDINQCDKQAFVHLANSSEKVVFLDAWCNIMSWEKITDYRQTELNCRLLKYWNILKEDKLYYQKRD